MNDLVKNLILWGVIALILLSVFSNFSQRAAESNKISYSDFILQVKERMVTRVTVSGREIVGETTDNKSFKTYSPETDNRSMIGDLLENNVEIVAQPPEQPSLLMNIFISWFPFLLLIGIWIFFMRQMQGGGGGRGAMSFCKSKARMRGEDQIKTTFADVAGVEEAKDEVAELVEFLRDPGKFQKLGGQIPRGVLMWVRRVRVKLCWLKPSPVKPRCHFLLFQVLTL